MFLDNEEARQKILKELRDALNDNCVETMRIKAADEIRERLEHVSELEPKKDVKDITKVTTILSRRVISLIFDMSFIRLLLCVTGI